MRISLAEKLKRRSDIDDILKTLSKVPDKAKYLSDKFNVGMPTASKAVYELFLPSDVKPEAGDKNSIIALGFINKISKEIKENPSAFTLCKVSNELESFNYAVLVKIFDNLLNKTTSTSYAFKLSLAIKYYLQIQYYELIFHKQPSQKLIERTDFLIKECL